MLSIMPPPKFKAFDSNGKPLAGGKVYTYIPGTSTPKATYADPNGTSANPNPVVLDSKGEATIWLQGFYKIVLTDSNNVQQWSVDQISSSPSVATPNAEWLSVNAAFTFVSATQFSVAGDMTGTYQAGRRVQMSVSAGTVYGTVTASVFSGGVTAVTIACDSGSIDAGLTAVNVGLLAAVNPSIPIPANGLPSAMPWVDARAYPNLAAAVSAVGSSSRVIFISTQQNVSSSLVVPSNVTLKFQQGGSINVATGATLAVNGDVDAGLSQIFTLNGTGAVTIASVREVYPQWFGAKGDGVADDTGAIQNAINAATLQYSTAQMNFYTEQTQLPLRFPKGVYRISSTLDLSFRNDILVFFDPGAKLKWTGAQDGLMMELKCSSRVKLVDARLDGNNAAGTFIHHSGNGTSEAGATHDLRTGKGNVSLNIYERPYLENQYTGSSKAIIDTIPYPADSSYPYYYSMDDSQFYSPNIRTTGTNGFGVSIGAQIDMYSPLFACPNGILIPAGAGPTFSLYSPTFSLQANSLGAIYVANGVHIANIDIFDGYLEGTNKPFFSFDPASTTGSIKKLGIHGGLYTQQSGATAFISVPSAIPGAIYIEGARNQNATQLPLKVDAAGCYVSINSGSMNEVLGNTSFVDPGFSVANALVTDLDRLHSTSLGGRVGFGASPLAALTAIDMQRVEVSVPGYRKLYLAKANYTLEDTGSTADMRLRVWCAQSGLTWTSPQYYNDEKPGFLLYDNSASPTGALVLVIAQLYNSNASTAYTPQHHAGWSLVLDNR